MDQAPPLQTLLQTIGAFARSQVLPIAEHIHSVTGFLSLKEGMALYFLAASGPGRGVIVEIGSFQGRSTIWLARGSLEKGREKVIAIDPHLGSPEHQPGAVCAHFMPAEGSTLSAFRNNLKRFQIEQGVEERVMTSGEAAAAWDGLPIRLLFIDGAHEYEAVEADFLGWAPKVVKEGIIAFHDVTDVGVGPVQVVNKYVKQNPDYQILGIIDSLLIVQKLV